jgi:hypothetical protein
MALGGRQHIRRQHAVHPRGDGLGIETVRGVRGGLFAQRLRQEAVHRPLASLLGFVVHQFLII